MPNWLNGEYTAIFIPYIKIETQLDLFVVEHYLAAVQCFKEEDISDEKPFLIDGKEYHFEELADYYLGYANGYYIYIMDGLKDKEYLEIIYQAMNEYPQAQVEKNELDWLLNIRKTLVTDQKLFKKQ